MSNYHDTIYSDIHAEQESKINRLAIAGAPSTLIDRLRQLTTNAFEHLLYELNYGEPQLVARRLMIMKNTSALLDELLKSYQSS